MKRFAAIVFVLVLLAAGGYAFLRFRPGGARAVAQATCPPANDLAAIEGYAPGAGGAAQQGEAAAGTVGGLGGALGGGTDATATPAPQPAGTCPPSSGASSQTDPLLANLDALAAAIPKESYDVDARAKTLANADASYAFVRDAIQLDNYAGAQRGARGALIANAANADDKALLLAALLQAQGETVRFARSTLAAADVASLGTAAATAPASPHPVPTLDPQLRERLHLAQSDLTAGATATAQTTSGALDDAVKLAAERADALAGELQRGGIRVAGSAGAPFDATHYYVQVQRQGTWTDADPMPGVPLGHHLGAADETFSADTLPDERFATVTFTVRASHPDGSGTDVLTQTKHSADLAGEPIHLVVSPDGSDAFASSAKSTSFKPALKIAGEVQSGDALDLAATGAGAVSSADLTIAVKTAAGTQTFRRTFFSRAPGDTNEIAAAKIANAYDVVVAPGPMSESFELAQTIASLRGALRPRDGFDAMPLPVVQLLHLDGIFARALAKHTASSVRFSYDRPVIAMLHRGFTAAQPIRPVADIDIVDNGERVTAADPALGAKANMQRGYMDTLIEQHLLAGTAVGAPQVFAAAQTSGVTDKTLASGAAVPSDVPAQARDQLGITLTSGNAAIVTGRPVDVAGGAHVAWWSIDPATGNTVGRLETGAGQGMAEYNRLQSEVARRGGPLVEFYGDFWKCIAWGVEAPLEGEGVATEVAFLTCIANAYCHLLQSIVNDHIPEDAAENAMEAATIREALQLVIKQRAEAYAKAQIEAQTGSLDAKKRLDEAMGKICDASFASPFK